MNSILDTTGKPSADENGRYSGPEPGRRGLGSLLRSGGMRHGATLWASAILAGTLDYGLNILAGRWLEPVQYGIFVCVAAILLVLIYLYTAIRNVVAFYTAKLSVQAGSSRLTGAFVHRAWRWAWQGGLVATALASILAPLLAHALRLSNPWVLWAACPLAQLLFLRAITDGAFQGTQRFAVLGAVLVATSVLRLLFTAGLIRLGWQAFGAVVAWPLAWGGALLLALPFLPRLRSSSQESSLAVSRRYSSYTLLGIGAFGLLSNLDALFVKHFFSPMMAGRYAPVVTLAKVSLFLPMALGIILLPKAVERQAKNRDAWPILLLALMGALAPGLALTVFYCLSSGWLVRIVFTAAYGDPGIVLGLASLAATLYAGLNIWLNYALSRERPAFIYSLAGVLLWQVLGMFVFGRTNLVHMAWVMVSAGALGNVAGFITTWGKAPAGKAIRLGVVRALVSGSPAQDRLKP